MTKTWIPFLLAWLCALMGPFPTNAQWMRTNGPSGENPFQWPSIVTLLDYWNGSGRYVLFAGSLSNGVFRSTDEGASWTPVNEGFSPFETHSSIIHQSKVFIGTEQGVFASSDEGMHWVAVNQGISGEKVVALATTGVNLYAGTSSGIYLSSDEGANWLSRSEGLTNLEINTIDAVGTRLFAGTMAGLFCSTDSGATWSPITVGLPPNPRVRAIISHDTTILAAIYLQGVYESTDCGDTWHAKNVGLPTNLIPSRLSAIPIVTGGHVLYLSGWYNGYNTIGLFRSTDDGSTWNAVGAPSTGFPVSNFASNGVRMFATAGGFFVSSDSCRTWSSSNIGLTFCSVVALATNGSNLFAGTYRGPGVLRSTDQGYSWIPTGVTSDKICAFASEGSRIVAGTWSGVHASTDAGQTWNSIGSDLPSPYVDGVAFSGSAMFVTQGYNGVYRTTDDGATWTPVNSGLESREIGALAARDSLMFAGASFGPMFRSSNLGQSWSLDSVGLPTSMIYPAFAFNSNGPFVFVVVPYKIYRSTVYGPGWEPASNGIPFTNISSLALTETYLFAGTDYGVYFSTDNGAHWNSFSTNLRAVNALAISSGFLFAGTNTSGIWKRSLSDLSATVHSEGLLPRYTVLEQNYPNPFNPSTTIRFSVSEPGSVSLEIFDLHGRHIAELIRRHLNPGIYEESFVADGLPSGVYFCRLQAGKVFQTIKLVLMK